MTAYENVTRALKRWHDAKDESSFEVKTGELRQLVAEIVWLRAALELYADPDNWETTYDDRLGPGETWLWSRP